MIKKPDEQEDKQKELSAKNLAYSMNIALLQFYKQMYNKYVINRLFLGDSGEPAWCVSFFSPLSMEEKLLPLMRRTQTLLHCAGQNPSIQYSPCPLSDAWCPDHLFSGPWSFYAQNLEAEMGAGERLWAEEKNTSQVSIPECREIFLE